MDDKPTPAILFSARNRGGKSKKRCVTVDDDTFFFWGGQRWIRTTEGVRQQIYSLPHLATLVFAQAFFSVAKERIIFDISKRSPPFLWL